MNKLYAPYIENILPAAAGGILNIPYENHPTVSNSNYNTMTLLIKDILNDDNVVGIVETSNINKEQKIATFELINKYGQPIVDFTLKAGKYYKAYLAYGSIKGNTIGYYSNSGVFKYTDIPRTNIELSNTFVAAFHYQSPENDITEKLYSAQFYLYNDSACVHPIEISEEILINYQTISNSDDFIVTHQFGYQFDTNVTQYYVKANYKTINNYSGTTQVATRTFLYVGTNRFQCFVNWDYWSEELTTEAYNFGLNQFYFIDRQDYEVYNVITDTIVENGGKLYQISAEERQIKIIIEENGAKRYDIIDWQSASLADLNRFILVKRNCSSGECIVLDRFESFQDEKVYYDVSLEQGCTYQYLLFYGYQDSDILFFANSEEVWSDFEDMFLYDNTHILRLRFDPKVTSFKTTKQVSKQDSIGGKYPIMFQNGVLSYKEFPISATLSYLSDSSMYFVNGLQDYEYNGLKSKMNTIWGATDQRVNTEEKLYLETTRNNYLDQMNIILYSYGYRAFLSITDTLQYYDMDSKESVEEDTVIVALREADETLFNGYKTKINDYTKLIKAANQITQRRDYYASTRVSGDNIYIERQYKLAVLDWLNNGQCKVFKSPTEGNYIVKLMNTSLAPKDQVGRMIHTMSTTAVEVMEYNNNNLLEHNLLLYTKL